MTQEAEDQATRHPGMDLGEIVLVLEKMGRRPRRLQGHIPVHGLSSLAELARVESPAWVDVQAVREQDRLRVTGHTGGRVGLDCGRCLKSFSLELSATLDREYVAGQELPPKGGELEISDEVVNLEDGVFSLRRMVEEELILALPMTHVCRDACAGLCAQCGADLNLGACGCLPQVAETPFAFLKNLGSFNP
ncbi:MAG: DUF177 domain-containing protein [Magnetococcales bacterium]|nr:DUF177 domain-containing protein [Magnetococcales bacterium]